MKKGFNTINILIGLILSLFIINLIVMATKQLKAVQLINYNQDILSSLQIYEILNYSIDIEVASDEIRMNYLNENRSIRFTNNKIIMSPGTTIYFLDVSSYSFNIEDDKIYLNLVRLNRAKKLLIGQLWIRDIF